MKYKIHLFTISFSKNLAQLRRKEQSALENILKIFESNLNSDKMLQEYSKCKNKLEEISDNIEDRVKKQDFIV